MKYENFSERKLFQILDSIQTELKELTCQSKNLNTKILKKEEKKSKIKAALIYKFSLNQKKELENIFSKETLEAIEEVEEMKRNPQKYPGYKSIDDLKKALLS